LENRDEPTLLDFVSYTERIGMSILDSSNMREALATAGTYLATSFKAFLESCVLALMICVSLGQSCCLSKVGCGVPKRTIPATQVTKELIAGS
jgi:hypothetical protein